MEQCATDIDALIERLRENASKPCGTDCCYTETMAKAADTIAELRAMYNEYDRLASVEIRRLQAEIAKLREALTRISLSDQYEIRKPIDIARATLGESHLDRLQRLGQEWEREP